MEALIPVEMIKKIGSFVKKLSNSSKLKIKDKNAK